MSAGAAPPDRLDALVEHIMERLTAAASQYDAPWRTPMLATTGGETGPALRTVVVRTVDPALRQLRINTDRRSDKIEQIADDPRVALGFWDPAANQQLRLAGRAIMDTDAATADAAWAALRPEGRLVYRSGAAPGTPITAPADARPADDDGSAGGRQALAVVAVTWERWDWLWLGPNGHRRARIRWSADGQRQADWVVP